MDIDITPSDPLAHEYVQKFSQFNQAMRWEAADILREEYLENANRLHKTVRPRRGFYVRFGKRTLDIVVSGIALIFSLPITLLLVPIVLLDVGRPVLFKQIRVGRGGRHFQLAKLRTMRDEVDENGKPLLGADRVTKAGTLIRRTSLDELLNFWSIFKGDMSLIGPRPLLPEYLSRYSFRHKQRLDVRPGLDCPLPRDQGRIPTYEDQFEHDCWYVENISLVLDLKLMFRIVATAFDRRQNKARGASARGTFMGYGADGRLVTTNDIPMWVLDKVLANKDCASQTLGQVDHGQNTDGA